MVALCLHDKRAIGDALRLAGAARLFLALAGRWTIPSVRVVRHAGNRANSVPGIRIAYCSCVPKPHPLEKTDEGFGSLGLTAALVDAIAKLGYEEPTPVQREAIPLLIQGRDILAQAATGTGKTAAFALPMVQHLTSPAAGRRPTRGLVLVPTRELAMQVAEAIHKYAKGTTIGVVPIYGGASAEQQIRALQRGADVVVATPGRALDHITRRTLKLGHVRAVTLDEADEMLDMGFADDLEAILQATPAARQTALFSATMPARIAAIASRHLKDAVRVTIAAEKLGAGKMPRVRQTAYIVSRAHKPAALGRLLDVESPASALVFCRTRLEVEQLTETLNAHGYRAEALHGGIVQRQRDRVMNTLRSAMVDLIVATDVSARSRSTAWISRRAAATTLPSASVDRTTKVSGFCIRCRIVEYACGCTGLSRPSCFSSATTPTMVTQTSLSVGLANLMRLPTASSPRRYFLASAEFTTVTRG